MLSQICYGSDTKRSLAVIVAATRHGSVVRFRWSLLWVRLTELWIPVYVKSTVYRLWTWALGGEEFDVETSGRD